MPKRKESFTPAELAKYDVVREKFNKAVIRKSHEFIQKARYDFTPRERRIVNLAMSQIKKGDTADTVYTLDLSELYDICGLVGDSYTEIKLIIKALSDKSWWLPKVVNGKEEDGVESVTRFFNTVDVDKKGTQKVAFKFHERMSPYIFALFEHYEMYGNHYATIMLKHTLPMSKKYSPHLYELLLSYQINNTEWRFEVGKLKRLLNCMKYTWKDFRLYALEPAIEEINKYTDISVYYEITGKTAKRVDEITFYMTEKSHNERIQAEKKGLSKLYPGYNAWDYEGQMSLFDEVTEDEND